MSKIVVIILIYHRFKPIDLNIYKYIYIYMLRLYPDLFIVVSNTN
jgi:hypothetical protein